MTVLSQPSLRQKSAGLVKRMFKRNNAVDTSDERGKKLSTAYCEHTWDLQRVSANHPLSRINITNPASSQGLSQNDALRILGENGPNSLPKPKEISDFMLFLKQFCNLLWLLLLVASTLSLLGYFADTSVMMNLYITIIMYAMIFIMCTISWWQERAARKVVRGFENLLPESCAVIRDGREISVSAPQLTIGDVIVIKNGSRVPADARVLSCSEFKLETSSITGEAEPIDFQWESVGEETSVFESRNVAFNGSLCVDGQAIAVVVRVGVNTVIGQIATLTTGQQDKGSQLDREISRFVKFLIVMAVSLGISIFIVGGIIHKWKHVLQLLANGFLVCAIGMVPCGLPATVTSILTIVARRLANRNVYLKRLDVVEALGSVSIIASDKTGTLTKNIMTVTDIWYCDKRITGFAPKKDPSALSVDQFGSVVSRLLTLMTVCNVADFVQSKENEAKEEKKGIVNPAFTNNEDGHKISNMVRKPATGSASEIAMLHYADALINVKQLREDHNMVFEIPFNSRRKWHLQIHRERDLQGGDCAFRLMMKGAPEILIKKCDLILTEQGQAPLDDYTMKQFQDAYDQFGREGRRVIGYVETVFSAPRDTQFKADLQNFPIDGLIFCGMTAIMDPPRDETAGAIAACKKAGIRVFMVTGDHPSTAEAIAKEIGLISEEDAGRGAVIHGDQIPKFTDEDWNKVLMHRHLVFARTTPEQKLLIVEQCQKRDETIAMTGDGVNDSPALKKANVGVAMGSGSEVAKQAADIILMDDNFSSIVLGIEQGRLMFDNVKKVLGYTMPHSFPEVYPVCINFVLGMPLGITSLQILTIDLGTELAPGIAMSQEPIENDVMERPPRRKGKKLVSNSLLAYGYIYTGQFQSAGCLLAYLYVFWHHGINTTDLLYSAVDAWQEGGKNFSSNGVEYDWPQQQEILRQACSAWHIGIVFGQFWHVWSVRTRRTSLFTAGIFSNLYTVGGTIFELCLLCFLIYTPGLNHFIGGSPPPPVVWAIVGGMGIFIFIYNEFRKFCIRRWPMNRVVHWFKW